MKAEYTGRAKYFGGRFLGLFMDAILVGLAAEVLGWFLPEWSVLDFRFWGHLPGLVERGLALFAKRLPGFPDVTEGLLYVCYVAFSAYAWGTTIGMGNMGLRFALRDGGRPGVRRILLRHVLSGLSFLTLVGYLWAIVDRQGRTLHDILSGIVVVHEDDPPGVWTPGSGDSEGGIDAGKG